MMRLLLFIYPDSYPDMSGYINTYTVHPKRGMKDVKEHLIRMHTEKASCPSASSFMHIMVCYLLKKYNRQPTMRAMPKRRLMWNNFLPTSPQPSHGATSPYSYWVQPGGLFFGAMPGLSPTMAVALLVPFTFYLPADTSLILLGAVYTSAVAGGSISAILLSIPGAPSSIATLFDGYPMAKQGRAQEALYTVFVSSLSAAYSACWS